MCFNNQNAAQKGNFPLSRLLIKFGADVNLQNYPYKYTALIYACENMHLEVAKLLLDEGADVALKNQYGKTAIFYGTIHGSKRICELLIKYDAELGVLDNDLRAPVMFIRDPALKV